MNNKFTVNDLNLYYGDFHALKNINLDIKEKEITAFMVLVDVVNQHF